MARQQVESEDELKRKQRRRLIGAVALFTALIIIVPLVLDNEPQTSSVNVDLRIPDRDQVGEFKSQMVLPDTIDTAASEPAAAEMVVPSTPAVVPETAPVVDKVVPAEPAKVVKATPKKTEKASKPEPKKAAQPKEGFVVQVGAYSNVKAALELRDKLKKQGLPVYTEKAGNTTRVRIGAYPTREAAEKVMHKLRAQGMDPQVVGAAS